MKIVVLDSHAALSDDMTLEILAEFGEVVSYDRTPKELTVERIQDAQIVLTNKVVLDQEVMDACPHLQYIGLFATGFNIVDVDYAAQRGITVCNVPGYSTAGVAQLTMAFILHFYSMVAVHDKEVKMGKWQNCADFCFYHKELSELAGKTIGLIGFGSIGKKVAQIAQAFDMQVLVHSRTVYPQYENDTLHFTSLAELYSKSDIISIHCPLFEDTKGMINRDAIAQMKQNCILINTARGPILNERDVADALNSGRIYGVGMDVASIEPISADNPLLSAKNCVITPHIAWAGKESRARLLQVVYENIKAYLAGAAINRVN